MATPPSKTLKERFPRSMKLDETACRICAAIIEEQRETAEDPSAILGPEHGCIDHMHYHARSLEESADECYKASLELIFSHVADIHMVILKILSEKYGHSVPDMLATVMKHKEWKNIYLHPTLKSLIYFDNINPTQPPLPPLPALKKVGVGGSDGGLSSPHNPPIKEALKGELSSQPKAPAPVPAPVPANTIIKRRGPKKVVEPTPEPPAPAPAPAPAPPTIKRRGPKPKNPV